ncbi:MAG: hypothetical protein GY809_28100 [Planctomycetes bacterium]|nr:hypothetical protein [Planctomycetota bacterium]
MSDALCRGCIRSHHERSGTQWKSAQQTVPPGTCGGLSALWRGR